MRSRYHAITDLNHRAALQGKIKLSKKNVDESNAALIPTVKSTDWRGNANIIDT